MSSICRLPSGQKLSNPDAQLFARELLDGLRYDDIAGLLGYPCPAIICDSFLAWPGIEARSEDLREYLYDPEIDEIADVKLLC